MPDPEETFEIPNFDEEVGGGDETFSGAAGAEVDDADEVPAAADDSGDDLPGPGGEADFEA